MFALGAVQTAGSFAAQSGAAAAHVAAAKARRDRKKKKGVRGKLRNIKRKTSRGRSGRSKQKRNLSSQKKSKNPLKNRRQKQRVGVESANRQSTKYRLRQRQGSYDQEKQRIISNPNLSEAEKNRQLTNARTRYVTAQRKELKNYRRRKAALKYAGRSYYSPNPYSYSNVLNGFYAGSLAGALLTTAAVTTTTTTPPIYGYPQQYAPSSYPYGTYPSYPSATMGGVPLQQSPQTIPSPDVDSPPKNDSQAEEGAETEGRPFPFNDQEMRSLAHHNTIAGRSVKSLENLKGVHLVTFLNARDEYMNEKDPDLQTTKGLQLMSVAKQLDKRYSTHAMAWGRVMKYRPPEWTREMAQYYADGAEANDMSKIADMSGAEVTKYLSDLSPEKLQEVQQTTQSYAMQSIGCSMDEHLTEAGARSEIYDQFTVYFSNERKQIVFHMNGFVEINSFITRMEAERYNIAQVVKKYGGSAIVKKDIKTKCDHLELFANVRMFKRMLTVFPLAIRNQLDFQRIIEDRPSFLTPDNEVPRMWVAVNIGQSEYIQLQPVVLSKEEKERTMISDGDLKTTNHLVTTISKIVAPYITLFSKDFPTLRAPPSSVQGKRLPGNSSDSSQTKKSRF